MIRKQLSLQWRSAAVAAFILAIFAILGSSLVSFSYQETTEKIAQNERDLLLRQLADIVPRHRFDNKILEDTKVIYAPLSLGSDDTMLYRARQNGHPVAVVFSPVIARGYSGKISLLIGVNKDSSLAGVRVISHKETPGLGDKIEVHRNPWITKFVGLSLNNPKADEWKVKRDKGYFDQFTGATITPRAIVTAIKKTLLYFEQHQDELFIINTLAKQNGND